MISNENEVIIVDFTTVTLENKLILIDLLEMGSRMKLTDIYLGFANINASKTKLSLNLDLKEPLGYYLMRKFVFRRKKHYYSCDQIGFLLIESDYTVWFKELKM